MNPGALDGLVVVDFSRVLAGPYATMMLGDFGADVIKIERPQVGDDTREWGPPYDSEGVATYFNAVNRNKRSVVLDLTDPADQQRARELVATADIVVENFRAGTMEKFGLDYETMRASTARPDLLLDHRVRPRPRCRPARLRPAGAGGRRTDERDRSRPR